MSKVNSLVDILSQNLTMNKARIDCFAFMVLSIINGGGGSLKKTAKYFVNDTKKYSNHIRIQRFLSSSVICYDEIARFIYRLFGLDNVIISIDRTNWKWGKKNSKVHNRHGEWVQVHKLLRNVTYHETMIFARRVKIDGCRVILCVKRSMDNELVIVASNDFEQFFAMDLYAKRWEIRYFPV